jgi:Domain of unknown function (DUF4124)
MICMGWLTGTGAMGVLSRARRAGGRLACGATLLALLPAAPPAEAQAGKGGTSPGAGGIYSCTDARGRRLTSDRPIVECLDREQRVMNKDGSTRATLPPAMTANERAAVEEAQRQKQLEEAARKDIIRHDRNLMARFRDEAAHQKAREAALDNLRSALKQSERRLAELEHERQPLATEAEFYKDKPLPPKLRSRLEHIEVAAEAQRTLVVNQQAEVVRINTIYDDELARLRKLWAGAQPGTVGPVPATNTATAAAKKL